MRKLNKPSEIVSDVYNTCLQSIVDPDLSSRLGLCLHAVEQSAVEFENKILNNDLHLITKYNRTKLNKSKRLINGHVTIDEMKSLYTKYFVPKQSKGRNIYDTLLLSANNNLCPLCSAGVVTTLDHHLPKAKYPLLSVVPVNLVPSCTDCNKSKQDEVPTCKTDQTLHPYFDNIENDLWLNAKVIPNNPVTIEYSVKPPSNWNSILISRVQAHFNNLNLNKSYSIRAAIELRGIYMILHEVFNLSGVNQVKQRLTEGVKGRSHENINSWQAALYRALENDIWFYSGGFENIPH